MERNIFSKPGLKVLLKWTLSALGLLVLVLLVQILKQGKFESSRLGTVILATTLGAIIIGFVFTIGELKYLPWRKRRLTKKLIRIFNGKQISDIISHFKYGDFDCYTEIEINMVMAQAGSYELIRFHVPREQIDISPLKSSFNRSLSNCNNIPTYLIHQANPYFLTFTKRKLEKKIGRKIL